MRTLLLALAALLVAAAPAAAAEPLRVGVALADRDALVESGRVAVRIRARPPGRVVLRARMSGVRGSAAKRRSVRLSRAGSSRA